MMLEYSKSRQDLAVLNLRFISHWGFSELGPVELSINYISQVLGAGFLQKSEVTAGGEFLPVQTSFSF